MTKKEMNLAAFSAALAYTNAAKDAMARVTFKLGHGHRDTKKLAEVLDLAHQAENLVMELAGRILGLLE